METFERFFEDMPINFFIHEGEVTARASEVGMCITNAKTPRDGIKRVSKIISRHVNDFRGLTVVVRLGTTDGKVYDTLCLKSRAIWLVAFFARGKKAEDFRLWASQEVDDIAKNKKVLVDREYLKDLIESVKTSNEQTALAFDAMEDICAHNKKIMSLAGQLLAARKRQLRKEGNLRLELSSLPLFQGEEFKLISPGGAA